METCRTSKTTSSQNDSAQNLDPIGETVRAKAKAILGGLPEHWTDPQGLCEIIAALTSRDRETRESAKRRVRLAVKTSESYAKAMEEIFR